MAAYDPIVSRPSDGANLPDALRRARYQQMLSEDLGRRPEGFEAAEPERGWPNLLVPIVGMVVVSIIVLGLAYVAMLWRDGAFDAWSDGPSTTAAQRAWQRADRARPVEETAPASSEMEEMLEDAKKPVEQAGEKEADTLEE